MHRRHALCFVGIVVFIACTDIGGGDEQYAATRPSIPDDAGERADGGDDERADGGDDERADGGAGGGDDSPSAGDGSLNAGDGYPGGDGGVDGSLNAGDGSLNAGDASLICSLRVLVRCVSSDGTGGVMRCGVDGQYGSCLSEDCLGVSLGPYALEEDTCRMLVALEDLERLFDAPVPSHLRLMVFHADPQDRAAVPVWPFRVGLGECGGGEGWYVADDGIYLCESTCEGATYVDAYLGCESMWREPG